MSYLGTTHARQTPGYDSLSLVPKSRYIHTPVRIELQATFVVTRASSAKYRFHLNVTQTASKDFLPASQRDRLLRGVLYLVRQPLDALELRRYTIHSLGQRRLVRRGGLKMRTLRARFVCALSKSSQQAVKDGGNRHIVNAATRTSAPEGTKQFDSF